MNGQEMIQTGIVIMLVSTVLFAIVMLALKRMKNNM